MPAGRPKKSTTIIEIKDLRLEFIISKEDDYQNEISFIKVVDKSFKTKLAPILSQKCDENRLPLWMSEDGIYMLKVKNRWMPEGRVFEKNELFSADLNFHYFSMNKDDSGLITGYYLKLSTNDVVFNSP